MWQKSTFLERPKAPKMLEINASPGFQGIESAVGIDIGARLIEFIKANAQSRIGTRRGRKLSRKATDGTLNTKAAFQADLDQQAESSV